jgi:hypothetical protein
MHGTMIPHRSLGACALSLLLLLPACGGGSADPAAATNAGYEALGKGDAGAAVDHFADALAALKPGDPGYKRARMGEVEAKLQLAPEAAASSFLEFAKAQPDQVAAEDYRKVGTQLNARKALVQASHVLDAGLKRFADDAQLKAAMEQTKVAAAEAEASGDTSAMDALRGLGYIGG